MVRRFDVRVDVSDAVGLDTKMETAAWVYVPNRDVAPGEATVFFAFPGGTYSRAYYDLDVPDRGRYSLANHLAAAGHIVVACDHIGIGGSTSYEPFADLTMDMVIGADDATVRGVLSRLATGTLVKGLAPLNDVFTIGIGHSMGAMLLTLQQSRYCRFDAVGLLGTSLLARPGSTINANRNVSSPKREDRTRPPRKNLHKFFHNESVPDEVIAADDAVAVRLYDWWFGGSIADKKEQLVEAGRIIRVPVFLGSGARDLSPDPWREPTAYASSPDITMFVLPDSAHCFNFAENRHVFFERLAGWGHAVSGTYRRARVPSVVSQ